MTEHTEDVLKTLRDELAGVSPSPEFQSRVRQRIAGELDLLREQLAAVEPSPEFKVRVRQEIDAAREERAASWLSGWRWVVPAGTAVAAVVIAMIVFSRPRQDAPQRAIAQALVNLPVPVVLPETPNVTPAPAIADTSRSGDRTVKFDRTSTTAVVASSSGPDLVVITNQPALLRAMWAGIEDRALAESSEALVIEGGQIVIAPLEVSPVVVKWLVEPPPEAGALPIIRRVSAVTAERSLQ